MKKWYTNINDPEPFNKCCVEEIKRIWEESHPMKVVWYTGNCPKCNHYIRLTQSSEKEAAELLAKYGLKYEPKNI